MFIRKLININLYQCEKGFDTCERILKNPYLLYVHRGKGCFKIGNQTHTAAAGDLFYCRAGIGNTIIADKSDPFLLSGIDFKFMNLSSDIQSMEKQLSEKINLNLNPFMVSTIDKMVQEFEYGKIGAQEICDSLLNSILWELFRIAKIGIPYGENAQNKILEYVKENFTKTVTHEELSRVFSYHKSSINRMIIVSTNLSLRQYQTYLRIKRASDLLLYSNLTKSEIARQCGYNSSVFFSRQFKQKTGLTPTQYRVNEKKVEE